MGCGMGTGSEGFSLSQRLFDPEFVKDANRTLIDKSAKDSKRK